MAAVGSDLPGAKPQRLTGTLAQGAQWLICLGATMIRPIVMLAALGPLACSTTLSHDPWRIQGAGLSLRGSA
jgi:hypothetical protein